MKPESISQLIFSAMSIWIRSMQSSFQTRKLRYCRGFFLKRLMSIKKVNRIMGMEFSDRLKRVVDEYNNRRRDEAFANEVLDDVAEQLAKLLEELKKEKDSFKGMGIDYEEKAFYDILKAVAKKYEFEYPDDKMIELSKRIKSLSMIKLSTLTGLPVMIIKQICKLT